MGLNAYKSGNYKTAASHFVKARKLDSSNHLALRYLKQAQAKLGD